MPSQAEWHVALCYDESVGDPTGLRLTVRPLGEVARRDVKPAPMALGAPVGLVLLIACVNLVRANTRERELAIRRALGATRLRLIRQLFCGEPSSWASSAAPAACCSRACSVTPGHTSCSSEDAETGPHVFVKLLSLPRNKTHHEGITMSLPRLQPLVLSMLLMLGTVPSTSAADPIGVVDQEVNPLDPSIGVSAVAYLFCCHLFGQSFTSALSGQLSAVQVLVAQGTNAAVEGGVTGIGFNLWRMEGDTITGQPLATVLLPQTAVPQEGGFVTADLLGAGVFVQPGEQLAFTLHTTSPHPTGYTWFGSSDAGYSGGASGLLSGGLAESLNFDVDLGFRTFVVEDSAAPVPEPGTMILVGSALAASALRRRRRP